MVQTLALFSDVGGSEVLILGIVALLLFGKNLPSVSRNIGRAIAEFKRAASDATTEIQREMNSAAEAVEADAAQEKAEKFPATPAELLDQPEKKPAHDVASANLNTIHNTARTVPAVSPAAALDAVERPTRIPPPVA
jgi:sec-independent protein translocase protein TatA